MILFFVQLPKAILPQRLDPLVLPCRMSATHSNGTDCVPFQQSMFPANFEFLAATAAYQDLLLTGSVRVVGERRCV
uniref:Uncharacterized protein n=1 Tax=Physcomitrium patens TaxID=3218 RepID=A0A2K1IYF4_PHYPA|nr:hypothetical protein PHYPA_024127 [Physcomitrium patens]